MAEVRNGKSIQCRCRLRDPDESADMGRFRTPGRFCDPLMDCKQCKERFRADKLIEDYNDEHGIKIKGRRPDAWSQEQMKQHIDDNHIAAQAAARP